MSYKLTETWKQRRSSGAANNKKETYSLRSKAANLSGKSEKQTEQHGTRKQSERQTLLGVSPSEVFSPGSYPLSSFEWNDEDLHALQDVEAKATERKLLSASISAVSKTHPKAVPVEGDFHSSTPICNHSKSRARHSLLSPVSHDPIPMRNSNVLDKPIEMEKENSIPKTAINDKPSPLSLDNWGLPDAVSRHYKSKGIVKMFDWQAQCLLTGKALLGGNLIYSAPTSAGKTLVAEILMLKRVLETKRKAIYILPFVSVAREKTNSLKMAFEDIGITVEGFMGAHAPPKGFSGCDIAICTIEKANSIVNRFIEEKTLSSVGVVVIDELHMLGDTNRGYLLELMLTKLLYVSSVSYMQPSSNTSSQRNNGIQVIGMSATLPNLKTIATWLKADLYVTTFRPVELIEFIKVGKTLLTGDSSKEIEIPKDNIISNDSDGVVSLCCETVSAGHSVLIFCPTKHWCEKLTEVIGKGLMSVKCIKKKNFDESAITEVIDQLRRCPVGLDPVLFTCIRFGVAFHHAGLTFDERDIVEDAFRRCVIKVLIATSTLSSGVNLPARRVLIRTPIFHGKPMDPRVYKQMSGRAGRKGVDDKGESILLCKPNEKQTGLRLLSADLKPVTSCLLGASQPTSASTGVNFPELKRALLEIICSGAATSYSDVKLYASCTFLKICLEKDQDERTFNDALHSTFQFLVEHEFVTIRNQNGQSLNKDNGIGHDTDSVCATQLGIATLASAMAPNEALLVFSELRRARKCFVLENELHVIYQVTPIYLQDQWPNLDWFKFFKIWEGLPVGLKTVAQLVGVEESFLARAVHGRISTRTEESRRILGIHRRFYAALALQDLVNEVPLLTVSRRYGVNRGLLQSLQASASTFAGMVTVFCQKLGWSSLELILNEFQSRLSFGVNRQLCDLVRVSSLNAMLARHIYNAGYHTVRDLALADTLQIETVLRNSKPFESKQLPCDDVKRPGTSSFMFIAGKCRLNETEAASLIKEEARQIIAVEIAKLGGQLREPGSGHIRASTTPDSSDSMSSNAKQKSNPQRHRPRSRKRRSFKLTKTIQRKRPSPPDTTRPSKRIERTNEQCKMSESIAKNLTPPRCEADSPSVSLLRSWMYSRDAKDTADQLTSKIDERKCPNDGAVEATSSDATDLSAEMICDSQSPRASISLLLTSTSNKPTPAKSESTDGAETDAKNSTASSLPLSDVTLFDASLSRSDGDTSKSDATANSSLDLYSATSEKSSSMADRSPTDPSLPRLSFSDSEPTASLMLALDDLESRATKDRPATPDHCNAESFTKIKSVNVRQNVTRQQLIEIIDVTLDHDVFQTFLKELRTKTTISMSLGTDLVSNHARSKIGQNLLQRDAPKVQSCHFPVAEGNDEIIAGLSISWGDLDAYYVDLKGTGTEKRQDILSKLKQVIECVSSCSALILFDTQKQLKLFTTVLTVPLIGRFEDPKVADWLLDPDGDDCNLHTLVKRHLDSSDCNYLSRFGGGLGTGGLGTVPQLRGSGRSRSCTEAVLTFKLMSVLRQKLVHCAALEAFTKIEMPCNVILGYMQCDGIALSLSRCRDVEERLITRQRILEEECFRSSGQRFSLTSPEEIARVLFIDLKLPCDQTLNEAGSKGSKRKLKHLATNKSVLEKLRSVHPLPGLIIEWRKVHCSLAKVVLPLLRIACQAKEMSDQPPDLRRIYPQAQIHTATGRISFCEPNLQSVPRDFDVVIPQATPCDAASRPVSMRTAFVAQPGCAFVSADYSQIELRLISHLAADSRLIGVLSSPGGDVFKMIAAETSRLPVDEVTPELRQRAKQMCYGIIYGMGRKLLAEQLSVDEKTAASFLDVFKTRYCGIDTFIKNTISGARRDGYITTLSGRRRYLTAINSRNGAARSQAERQAVNSTVQGSAADLVKAAMVGIDKQLKRHGLKNTARLVLQLHDELMYEIEEHHVNDVIDIIRHQMETAVKLSVPIPVKLRTGKSWGELTGEG